VNWRHDYHNSALATPLPPSVSMVFGGMMFSRTTRTSRLRPLQPERFRAHGSSLLTTPANSTSRRPRRPAHGDGARARQTSASAPPPPPNDPRSRQTSASQAASSTGPKTKSRLSSSEPGSNSCLSTQVRDFVSREEHSRIPPAARSNATDSTSPTSDETPPQDRGSHPLHSASGTDDQGLSRSNSPRSN